MLGRRGLKRATSPQGADAVKVNNLVDELTTICGSDGVVSDPLARKTYESDGLLQYKVQPGAVALPTTTEQVSAVVRLCHNNQIPWVARGSGTGLSGGAVPVGDGVLIVLSRMRRILEVDLSNQRIVVEPGVINREISDAVGPSHFYPPDPSSQVVCSIGGNIAENSGGLHCFKYGFTTNYVTGLEIVMPDGTVVELGGKELDAPGYDLTGVFVGSEGTLGIATRITLRVIPVPETVRTLIAYFREVGPAGRTVSDIVAAGATPGAIEMMDNAAIRACEEATHAGMPVDAGAALIVEIDGPRAECDERFSSVVKACEDNGATDVRVAADDEERELIWKARKAAFASMGRIAPNYYVQDGVIPRTRLGEVLERIAALGREYDLVVANVFHAGDGNLHPLVCYDGSVEGEAERAEECAGLILKACLDAGGSITGEHGVGIDKKRYMKDMFSDEDLATFQRLRCAFDPLQRANPGKVMPTPRLCGEVPGPYRRHPLEVAGIAERL
ncbi:MAG: FAD-binding protein [Actinobacteria bacterium]|nr:FAD-binding protein [Actinomycetota bacterium]